MEDFSFLDDEPNVEAEPEVPETQAAAPQLDEAAIRQRYVQPLEEKLGRLESVLDPQRIQAFQNQQQIERQRYQSAAQFRAALDEGDGVAALKALMPQLAMWDQAHQLHVQNIQAMQQWREEQEERNRIAEEIEQDERYFYAIDPEGQQLLRDFIPLATRAFAEQRGPGQAPTKEDHKAAEEWMKYVFAEKPSFVDAAKELASWVRQYKSQQAPPQQRKLPMAPAPGSRPRRSEPNPTRELLNDFLS